MGLVDALALTLFACAGTPQDAPPQSNWFARALDASDRALEELVFEMEEHARSASTSDADFGSGYCAATCMYLAQPPESPLCGLDLEARLLLARGAAATWGTLDDRLSVENEYARSLDLAGRKDDARRALEIARATFAGAERNLPDTLVQLAGSARKECDLGRFLSLAEEAQSRLEVLITRERLAGDVYRLCFHRSLEVELLGEFLEVELLLGRPDRAAVLLEEQARVVDELAADAPVDRERIRHAMDECVFGFATLDRDLVLRTVDETRTFAAAPEDLTSFAFYHAMVQVERLRDHTGDADSVRKELVDFLARANLDAQTRAGARIQLAEVELIAGDALSAASSLARAEEAVRHCDARQRGCAGITLEDRLLLLRSKLALANGSDPTALTALREDLRAAFERFLAHWSDTPRQKGGLGILHWPETRWFLSASIECTLRLDPSPVGREQALGVVLHAQSAGSLLREQRAQESSLADIRRTLLSEETGLAVLLPGLEKSLLFLCDSKNISCLPLERRDVLVARARAFAKLIGQLPTTKGVERAAKLADAGGALRDALFHEEARERMRAWKGFYFCGGELAANPALEALPWDDTSMGVRFGIASLPSVHLGMALAREATEARTSSDLELLVLHSPDARFATSDGGSPLADIALDAGQAEALLSSRSADQVCVLRGANASVAGLANALERHPQVVALFAHGVHDFARERPAGLALTPTDSEDGFLWCEEVELLPKGARFVGLYSCGSALGPARLGDDTAAHLGSSFLARGVPCVLLSRAPVVLEAALLAAQTIDDALLIEGVTPAEAARRARERLARSENFSDPFFHGSLALLGLGHAHVVQPVTRAPELVRVNSHRTVWIVLACLALGALALAAFWRTRRARSSRTPVNS